MSVSGIEAIGFTPFAAPQVSGTEAVGGGSASRISGATGGDGADFGSMVLDGLNNLEAITDKTDKLAVQAATGDLNAIHDYTIAATEASVTTQLTVAVRNKAVEAFNEIMRMQV